MKYLDGSNFLLFWVYLMSMNLAWWVYDLLSIIRLFNSYWPSLFPRYHSSHKGLHPSLHPVRLLRGHRKEFADHRRQEAQVEAPHTLSPMSTLSLFRFPLLLYLTFYHLFDFSNYCAFLPYTYFNWILLESFPPTETAIIEGVNWFNLASLTLTNDSHQSSLGRSL